MDSVKMLKRETLWAYVATRVLDTPFWGLYNLLFFILYKDLGATPFQIALLVMLKPLTSFFAMYWSSSVRGRRDRLVGNLLWARILSYVPFFFVPFIDTPWFFIAIYGLYMMLSVGMVPAWMELLKLHLPKETREKTFAYTQAFGYMGGGLLPFVIGGLLDSYTQAWRWLFPIVALIGLLPLLFQRRIRVDVDSLPLEEPLNLAGKIKEPWTQAFGLLKERIDFRKFQVGFFLLGSGLMILQPALPAFFVDVLNLSYTELSIAITLCKGIGFALAAPLWTRTLGKSDLFPFSSLIAALACLFPLCLLLASTELLWLYGAYLLYGLVQAGSELSWNMSGPIFSKDQDSSLFSSVNIIFVGLRGALIPTLGSLLVTHGSSPLAMLGSVLFCLAASFTLAHFARQNLTEKAG